VKSEDDGNGGWDLTVNVTSPTADVTVSVRPLKDVTGVTDGHAHDLQFTHPLVHVTVPAGQKITARVTCPDGYKGITATYDTPPGILFLGDEPEPINRDFDLVNTTDHDLTVDLDLICLRITTGTEIDALDPVVNTATVATTTTDPNPANNSSSVAVTISRQAGSTDPTPDPTPTPGPGPAPHVVTPAASPKLKVKATTLAFSATGSSVTVPVSCTGTGTCTGTVSVTGTVAAGTRAAGRSHVRTVVLGKAKYKVKAGRTVNVTVKVGSRYRKLAKAGKLKTVKVTAGKTTVTRKTKVAKPKAKSKAKAKAKGKKH